MTITREELVAVLIQDDYYRKKREWPLIEVNNSKRIRVKKCEVFYIGDYRGYDNFPSMDIINNKFMRFYPNISELLNTFGDNLIAAGGSICRLLNNCTVTSDVDFFFYDLDIENANKLRIVIIKFLIKTWRSQIGANISRNHINDIILNDVKFYINRNEFTTTIHIEEYTNYRDSPFVHMYQFIHRIYPNKSSIIGGFDISASMLLYDGKKIYTTPLGLWSQTRRSIIVDMSRRSTSYEYRLQKYAGEGLDFNIIFPGLSKDSLFNTYNFNIELSELLKKYSLKKIDDDDMIVTFDNSKNLKYLDFSYDDDGFFTKGGNGLRLSHKNYDPLNNYDKAINNGRRSDFSLYLDQISDYANDDKFIVNNCDYGNNGMMYKCVPLANATRLGLSNLASVVSTLTIQFVDENYIDGILSKEINNPNLGITDKVLKWYTERFYMLIYDKKSDIYCNYNTAEIIKSLGKDYKNTFFNKYEKINNVLESLILNIKQNTEICRQNLIGIKWITNNPGRQWTSSINPIFSNPRDWYGENYIPVLVGIPPEIETCLRLLRIRSIWSILNNDVFNHILFNVYENYANKAWDYI